MTSWTGDINESDEDPEEKIDDGFASKLQSHVDDGVVPEMSEMDLLGGLKEIDDLDLLKQAHTQLSGNGHKEKQRLIEKRINDLEPEEDEGNGEPNPGKSESTESGSPAKGAEPAIESMEGMDDQSSPKDSGMAESAPDGGSEDSHGPPEFGDALTPQEAAAGDRRWKVLVWGPPKLFKTHFCFTTPAPVAFLDLEGKADDISLKFSEREIRIWQPKRMTAEPDTKFRRAKKALLQALEWLDWHREHNDQLGTIVVDSMSLMWEWAQFHHKIENYPTKDPDEIELSAHFKSSKESDWAVIKEYHNGEFRDLITDSPYHFCWTAMEREDYKKRLEEDSSIRFMEPKGEPNNDYKADTVIRARKDDDRGKVGDLVGSNYTDNVFVGLQKPTFPKVRDAVERIAEVEATDESTTRGSLASEIGAEAVIDYDPQVYVQE